MLNEKDIIDYTSEFADLQPEASVKKLFELPRDSYFKIDDYDFLIKLHNLDGLYSFCTVAEGPNKGQVTHISVHAPVILYK